MNMSNIIANMILKMLEDDGSTEIQRNEFAQSVGCVPSQINYVISSRFTPEHGYFVESRRGGGGYIRITRASYDKGTALMHLVNDIGESLDEATCRAHLYNLNYQNILDTDKATLMLAATSDKALRQAAPETKNKIRASILKNMILSEIKKG